MTRLLGLRAKFLWAYLRDQLEAFAENKESRLPASTFQMLRLGFVREINDPRLKCVNKPAPPASVTEAAPPAGVTEADAKTAEEQTAKLPTKLYERLREIDGKSRRNFTSISQIPPTRFAAAILELAELKEGTTNEFGQFLEKLRIGKSPLHGPVNSAWRAAQGDLVKFSSGVESWFDGEMQRMSRLYRHHTRWIVFWIALVVTLFTAFDALAYGRALLGDAAFRAEAVAVASGDPDKLEELRDECVALQAEGEEGSDQGGDAVNPYTCVSDVLGNPSFVRILGDAAVSVDVSVEEEPNFNWNFRDWWQRTHSPPHWIGFILTVVALLFGGPFWWDILRRLTGVRSAQSISSTKG